MVFGLFFLIMMCIRAWKEHNIFAWTPSTVSAVLRSNLSWNTNCVRRSKAATIKRKWDSIMAGKSPHSLNRSVFFDVAAAAAWPPSTSAAAQPRRSPGYRFWRTKVDLSGAFWTVIKSPPIFHIHVAFSTGRLPQLCGWKLRTANIREDIRR